MKITGKITFNHSPTPPLPPPPPPKAVYTGYLGLYRSAGGNDHDWMQPAVIPSQWRGVKSSDPNWFTESMQWLSWELVKHFNSAMGGKQWASTYNGDKMLTNYNGWDSKTDPEDQRRDYVNNRYAGYPDPKLMDNLWCAGNLMPYMEEADGHLWAVPGKSGIDLNKPLPSVEEVVKNRWYMVLTVNQKSDLSNTPFDFPNGLGGVVVHPYFLKERVPYTKSHFMWWEEDYPPSPYRIYYPSNPFQSFFQKFFGFANRGGFWK